MSKVRNCSSDNLKDLIAKVGKTAQKTITIRDGNIGAEAPFCQIAGPCAVESREQLFQTLEGIRDYIHMIRGGAFKPRTNPDSFQGLGEEGLKILAEARETFDLPVVTEVMSGDRIELVSRYADVLQVGSRNMQNFALLKKLAEVDKPILLKRGFCNTIEEWLSSAMYILQGNSRLILCGRGIRTPVGKTIDINGLLRVKKTGVPVIVDPSHGSEDPDIIPSLFNIARASSFAGTMIEVHYSPPDADCDGHQALTPEEYTSIEQIAKTRSAEEVCGGWAMT